MVESVKGELNVLQGLALHRGLSPSSSSSCSLRAPLASSATRAPSSAAPTGAPPLDAGQGRITVQLGCCYNYATGKNGNPHSILPDEKAAGMPRLLEQVLDRMTRRGIFSAATRPDRFRVTPTLTLAWPGLAPLTQPSP